MYKITTKQGDHKAKIQNIGEVESFDHICEDLQNEFYKKMMRACGYVACRTIEKSDKKFVVDIRPVINLYNNLLLTVEKI